MLCSIYKQKISRAMDSGKSLSGLAKRHLRRCESCRKFVRISEELGQRLTEDAAALLQGADASPGERVMISLGTRAKSPSLPKCRRLRPVLAAAASVTVVSVSVVWLITFRPNKMPPLDTVFEFGTPGTYLEKAWQKAESPYAAEIRELKQAFKSKADAIQACLDVNLGEKTD
jgi:hypothetical protein